MQVLGGLYVVARITSIFSLLTLTYLGNERHEDGIGQYVYSRCFGGVLGTKGV